MSSAAAVLPAQPASSHLPASSTPAAIAGLQAFTQPPSSSSSSSSLPAGVSATSAPSHSLRRTTGVIAGGNTEMRAQIRRERETQRLLEQQASCSSLNSNFSASSAPNHLSNGSSSGRRDSIGMSLPAALAAMSTSNLASLKELRESSKSQPVVEQVVAHGAVCRGR